jgi:hypothetical protein
MRRRDSTGYLLLALRTSAIGDDLMHAVQTPFNQAGLAEAKQRVLDLLIDIATGSRRTLPTGASEAAKTAAAAFPVGTVKASIFLLENPSVTLVELKEVLDLLISIQSWAAERAGEAREDRPMDALARTI